MKKLAAVASLLSLLISPASAALTAIPYTKQAIEWNASWDYVAKELNLSEEQSARAKQLAAEWLFVGPCHGDARKLPDNGASAVSMTGGLRLGIPEHKAILLMIATLNMIDLGRDDPGKCRFALEMSKP
jgi:hypothetical protein